ncbi:isochorismatase family cysteine hydrolase [Streptomyces sp. B-S-A8]|uniref:Isochorismatase family cysteine hydrolase n=1 Tax=Streptomyces solicavernae TaxID=3043614 RepID=A0ABT6S274_9ACTN|nr:isochorismatase family cysteine hydrolase [Streptomyces sp. B-S-A8]MDI3389996.1 isochorismatase family cysteine hydrolase [Streptomyces sp. B-S-A8]
MSSNSNSNSGRRRPALLVLDLINEIVHPDGKYAADGYFAQARDRSVLERTAEAIARARAADIPVIYVVVGFSADYTEWPAGSPVFEKARADGRLKLGTWATQVHDALAPEPGEPVVAKHRISPFHGTNLELLLRTREIDTLLLTGVSTELVVLTTAQAGHDLDFRVQVLEDATLAGDAEIHAAALKVLSRIATVTTVEGALPSTG